MSFWRLQAHPWFKGIEWEKLYQMEVAFIPEVNGELDTQSLKRVKTKCLHQQNQGLGERLVRLSVYRLQIQPW
ncbi:putative AGC-kinase [Helianthus annuus]|nr:putative AGC-kinase [Helianthus annuus]